MKAKLLWALLLLLVGGCVYLFFVSYERYEEELDLGYSKEARQNPFLAAQLFLAKESVEAETIQKNLDLSNVSSRSTLFISKIDNVFLTDVQVEKALEWIASGGHLIASVDNDELNRQSLLHVFDVTLGDADTPSDYWRKLKASTKSKQINDILDEVERQVEEQHGEKLSGDDDSEGNQNKTLVQLPAYDYTFDLAVHQYSDVYFYHPKFNPDDRQAVEMNSTDKPYRLISNAGDNYGLRFVQFEYGAGKLTLMPSNDLWRNEYVGEADHAYLLSALNAGNKQFLFFYNASVNSVFVLLKTYFFESLIAALLLLLLWLWKSSVRVGGLKLIDNQSRRQFADHLRATAEFYSTHLQYSVLLEAIQDDIDDAMQLVDARFAHLSEREKTELLVQRSKVPEEKVKQWFSLLKTVDSDEEFFIAVQLSNTIRKRI